MVFDAEVDALKTIPPHENIIGLIEAGESVYQMNEQPQGDVKYIALELAKGGELFQHIMDC